MIMLQKYFLIVVSIVLACLCVSCEPEEDFGFPSKIEISGYGETVEMNGRNDLPTGIVQIQVLDYNGDGNSSGPLTEEKDCLGTTMDWLTVMYSFVENKLVLIAKPNETNKTRKLYLYLLSGKSRQEIIVTQSK